VSGYLRSGQGWEASHAWVSVFVPGTGWLDFDPTNDVLPSGRHITLAWGRDFSVGEHTIEVDVRVVPI
jgi:transglutaminase-like putative cysteine protease